MMCQPTGSPYVTLCLLATWIAFFKAISLLSFLGAI